VVKPSLFAISSSTITKVAFILPIGEILQSSVGLMVVMVLLDPFRGMAAYRNYTKTQQHGPEVKHGRSSAKDGAPKRFRCGKIQEKVS